MAILGSLAFLVTAVMPQTWLDKIAPPRPAPEPYTLAHLIGWLEGMPAGRAYEWNDCDDCLIAQYAKHCDADARLSQDPYQLGCHRLSEANGDGVARRIDREVFLLPRTFGGALKRARALEVA